VDAGQWTAAARNRVRDRHRALSSSAAFGRPALRQLLHGGGVILDISDMTQPRALTRINITRRFRIPRTRCLRFRTDQGPARDARPRRRRQRTLPYTPAFLWIYDVTNETTPVPIGTFQVPGIDPDGAPQPPMTGCHQTSERLSGTIVPCAWFAQGLRLLDISDPFAPKEVGSYQPDPAPGAKRASSNDVTIDDRGLIYLVDRQGGIDILETSVCNRLTGEEHLRRRKRFVDEAILRCDIDHRLNVGRPERRCELRACPLAQLRLVDAGEWRDVRGHLARMRVRIDRCGLQAGTEAPHEHPGYARQ